MRHASGLLATFALLAAAPALAQATATPAPAAPPESDTTIVVEGQVASPPRNEVYDQAVEISRVDAHKLYEQALPRFSAPLCPGVLGLKPQFAPAMANRMRQTIARLRLPLQGPGCSPNILVDFVDSGQMTLTELEQKQPGLFHLLSEAERTELLTEDSPVRVWNNIAVRWTGSGAPPAGWPDQKASVWGQLDRGSLPEAYDIRATLVLFDRSAVHGMNLAQLADYALMRGLTHTRPPSGDARMSTILGLFAGSDSPPRELTRFDIGYLRSLYSDPANRPAVTKLLGVRSRAEHGAPNADE